MALERLQDLESLAFDHGALEDLPKRRVYVYYCEICSSVLKLSTTLNHPHSFASTIMDSCPNCHFENSLQCHSLELRIPKTFLTECIQQRALQRQTPSPLFKSFLTSNKTQAAQEKAPHLPVLRFGAGFSVELGLSAGQLAVLYGDKVCQTLAGQLCVRSQLPIDAGGFGASSVFIDGGNIFDLYAVSGYTDALQLDRETILRGIKVSRAFTCYQLVSLIVEKLPCLIGEEDLKLVVVGNFLDMFVDPEIDLKEAKHMVNFLAGFLAKFARENNVAIVVTCPSRKENQGALLLPFLTSRAEIVLKVEQKKFVLEKHPLRKHSMLATN